MTVIALDPGGTTGCAIHTDKEYILAAIRNPTDLWEIIEHHKPDVVVFENFQSAGLISKDGQATLRLIGAIEIVCYKLQIPCLMQTPAERYGMMEPARAMLRQLGHKIISHEVDALAHLLLYESRVEAGVADAIYARRRHTGGPTT